jgi:hypothetical protein
MRGLVWEFGPNRRWLVGEKTSIPFIEESNKKLCVFAPLR